MFVDERNRIMCSRLEPGASIGYHKHENGSEMIYILQGKGKALYDDGEEELMQEFVIIVQKGILTVL